MHIALYERIWLGLAIIILLAFLGTLTVGAVTSLGTMPGHSEIVNPQKITVDDPRFSQPRVEMVAPGVYEAYVVAKMYNFYPQEIRVPAGSQVTFLVTSPDVIHGFEIAGTNINAMVAPGYVTKISGRFTKRGEYLILCNEYCGLGHQAMTAKLVVE